MYHLNHSGSSLISYRASFPSERNLFLRAGNCQGDSGLALSTDAKPRLKWTTELHERFVEAVNQLGGPEKATPKTVMRLMGIPELTLYHLKSHLQKYRLSKNLHVQVSGRALGNGPIAEGSVSTVNNGNLPGSHSNKTANINEALEIQIEVQRQLKEQLEVQRHLQMRIEAQGKYLQSVLEKAQETLGKQNLGTVGFQVPKVQLSDHALKALNECCTNASTCIEKIPDQHNLQRHAYHFADGSMDSCLTTCEGSQMDRDMHNTNMIQRAYHGNSSLGKAQMEKSSSHEQIQSAWCGELNGHIIFSLKDSGHSDLPVERDSSILSIRITNQTETARGDNINEACHVGRDEKNAYPIQQKGLKNLNDYDLPFARRQLDLNVHDTNNHAAPDYKEFDLNCFS